MKQPRKRKFTLIEILISLGLVTSILSTLLFFYTYINRLDAEMRREAREGFELRLIQVRLSPLFQTLFPPDDKTSFFFTTPEAKGDFTLVFSYNNGFMLDSRFANEALGRLLINEQDQLLLLTWPGKKAWEENILPPVHMEVLLEHVKNLKFRFFPRAEEGIQPQEEWPRNLNKLPATLKMSFTHKGRLVFLSFPLPLEAIPYNP